MVVWILFFYARLGVLVLFACSIKEYEANRSFADVILQNLCPYYKEQSKKHNLGIFSGFVD